MEESWHGKDTVQNIQTWRSQHQAGARLSFPDLHSLGFNDGNRKVNDHLPATRKSHKCCAYIASKSTYCARVNSVQSFCDITRDVRIL